MLVDRKLNKVLVNDSCLGKFDQPLVEFMNLGISGYYPMKLNS